MRYHIAGISEETHNRFVWEHPYGAPQQYSAHSELRASLGWRTERVDIFDERERQVAAVLLDFKKVPGLPWTLSYIRTGMTVDYDDPALLKAVMELILPILRRNRCAYVLMDPLIRESQKEAFDGLIGAGFIHSGFKNKIGEITHLRLNAMVPLQTTAEETLKSFSSRARNGIYRSERSGFSVIKGDESHLPIFYALMKETAERDNISIRRSDYYRAFYEAFHRLPDPVHGDPLMELWLVRLQAQSILPGMIASRESFQKKLSAEKQKTKVNQNRIMEYEQTLGSLETRIKEMRVLEETEPDGVYLCASFVVRTKDVCHYVFAASSNRYRHTQPSYAMIYAAVKDAIAHGCRYFNLGGFEPDEENGLASFKYKWNPEIVTYCGEFTYPVTPLGYRVVKTLLDIKQRRELKIIARDDAIAAQKKEAVGMAEAEKSAE